MICPHHCGQFKDPAAYGDHMASKHGISFDNAMCLVCSNSNFETWLEFSDCNQRCRLNQVVADDLDLDVVPFDLDVEETKQNEDNEPDVVMRDGINSKPI